MNPRIQWLLWRQIGWRHWRHTLKQTVLLVLIVALGVAVFLSVRLANRAAVAGFTLFTESISGESDLIISPLAGKLQVDLLTELRQTLDPLPVALYPVIETTASEPGQVGDSGLETEQFHLIGIDLVALVNIAYLTKATSPAVTLDTQQHSLGDQEDRVFISQALADERQLKVTGSLALILNDRTVNVQIAGILPEGKFQTEVPRNLLLMDLPSLQRMLPLPGQMHRIEVRVPEGKDRQRILTDAQMRLEAMANDQWTVHTPDSKRSSAALMTAAFRLNLSVLSTLALLVGIYLILQALEAAVVRRRQEIAVLRSLGVSAQDVRFAWLIEASALGVIGSALGILLGTAAAQISVRSIAQTVNVLYYSNTTTAASLTFEEGFFAFGFGVLASVIAGAVPARDAALTPPAQSLRHGIRHPGIAFLSKPWLGLLAAIIAILLANLPPLQLAAGSKIPVAGYFAAFFWLLSASILTGILFPLIAKVMRLGRNHAIMAYTASQLCTPSGRHRLTAAGLVVAVGMASAMGILIGSFEHTLQAWIGQVLRADVYVAPRGFGNASNQSRISRRTQEQLLAHPQVVGSDVAQFYPITLGTLDTTLVGARYTQLPQGAGMVWLKPPLTSPILSETSGLAWVSESFTARFNKRLGDTIQIPTQSGSQALTIDAVFADYGNERGSIVVPLQHTAKWFQDTQVSNLAVYLHPDADADAMRREWARALPELAIQTNTKLRAQALRIFRQTFSVTHALQGIGVAVAIVGLGLALASLLTERRQELMTLKALGLSRRGIAMATNLEGIAVATVGIIGGLTLSLTLGHLLIYVINPQSFGWTLSYQVPWATMAGLVTACVTASAFVSYGVGYWGASLPAEQEA